MDIRKVKHLIAIAENGGYGKAAIALNVTQSALTKSVQAIEGRLGLLLFERGPRGTRLTDEGRWFVDRWSRILADMAQLEAEGRSFRGLKKGLLRIGTAPAALDVVWTEALPRFAERYPLVKIRMISDSVEHIGRQLLSGELDMAIGALGSLRRDPSLAVRKLRDMPVAPFVRRGHPLDRPRTPSPAAIFQYPMVTPTPPEDHLAAIQARAREAGSPFDQPHIVTDSFAVTRRLVERTDAFSVIVVNQIHSDVFQRHFRAWPHQDFLPSLGIDLAVRSGWDPPAPVRAIISIFDEAL